MQNTFRDIPNLSHIPRQLNLQDRCQEGTGEGGEDEGAEVSVAMGPVKRDPNLNLNGGMSMQKIKWSVTLLVL